jgi:hypothetical protein
VGGIEGVLRGICEWRVEGLAPLRGGTAGCEGIGVLAAYPLQGTKQYRAITVKIIEKREGQNFARIE